MKKKPKTVSTRKKKGKTYLALSTVNTILFGQVPPNLIKQYHKYPISLLKQKTDESGLPKKTGYVRIRNTEYDITSYFTIEHLSVGTTAAKYPR